MAYTPTDWTDGVTPVNAALMDKIEQGIDQAHDAIANLTSVEYEGTYNPSTPYQPGDVVVYNGVEYLAVNPSTGSTPPPAVQSPPTVITPVTGYGTVLPASPVNGEEYILVDSLTAPTYQWRFRYVATITDAYKWVFVGGSPLTLGPQGSSPNVTSTTFVALTGGPTITLPRAGNYILQWGMRGQAQNTALADATARAWNGSAAGQVGYLLTSGTTAYLTGNATLTERWLAQAAATVLSLQVAVSAGGQANFMYAWLALTPLRVS